MVCSCQAITVDNGRDKVRGSRWQENRFAESRVVSILQRCQCTETGSDPADRTVRNSPYGNEFPLARHSQPATGVSEPYRCLNIKQCDAFDCLISTGIIMFAYMMMV